MSAATDIKDVKSMDLTKVDSKSLFEEVDRELLWETLFAEYATISKGANLLEQIRQLLDKIEVTLYNGADTEEYKEYVEVMNDNGIPLDNKEINEIFDDTAKYHKWYWRKLQKRLTKIETSCLASSIAKLLTQDEQKQLLNILNTDITNYWHGKLNDVVSNIELMFFDYWLLISKVGLPNINPEQYKQQIVPFIDDIKTHFETWLPALRNANQVLYVKAIQQFHRLLMLIPQRYITLALIKVNDRKDYRPAGYDPSFYDSSPYNGILQDIAQINAVRKPLTWDTIGNYEDYLQGTSTGLFPRVITNLNILQKNLGTQVLAITENCVKKRFLDRLPEDDSDKLITAFRDEIEIRKARGK